MKTALALDPVQATREADRSANMGAGEASAALMRAASSLGEVKPNALRSAEGGDSATLMMSTVLLKAAPRAAQPGALVALAGGGAQGLGGVAAAAVKACPQ